MKHTCILFTALAVSIHLSFAAGLSSAAILYRERHARADGDTVV